MSNVVIKLVFDVFRNGEVDVKKGLKICVVFQFEFMFFWLLMLFYRYFNYY